jgi:uncharacterized membrane protein
MVEGRQETGSAGDGRQRVLVGLGLFVAAAVAVYLIGGWLQAVERDERAQLTFEHGWVLVRPLWIYPVALLVIAFVLVLALGVMIARKQAAGETWRAHVFVEADYLQHELDILKAKRSVSMSDALVDSVTNAVKEHLKEAREAADPKNRPHTTAGRIVEAWSAAKPTTSFHSLHAAEVAMVPLLAEEEIEARIPEALARLEQLRRADQRRREAEVQLREGKPGARRRAEYAMALRLGYELKDGPARAASQLPQHRLWDNARAHGGRPRPLPHRRQLPRRDPALLCANAHHAATRNGYHQHHPAGGSADHA